MSLDVPQMLFIGIALAIPTTIVVVYLGLDLTLRDRAVTATMFGRIWFELPYEQVWKVEVAPMRMRVTVFGISVFDSDRELLRAGRLRKVYTNPFVRRVAITCVNGDVVLVTPDDREEFIRELWRRRGEVAGAGGASSEGRAALQAADDVIARRIAQERADAAEKNE